MKIELWGNWSHTKSLTVTGSIGELDITIEDIVFDETFTVECGITSDLDFARLVGTVGAGAELTCARCLKRFRMAIAGEFEIVASRLKLGEVPPKAIEDEDIGGDEADMVFVPYGENAVDITRQVHDAIVLGIPVKPLHSDMCRGLCAVCGADLNEETCGCEQPSADDRWSALRDLKKDVT